MHLQFSVIVKNRLKSQHKSNSNSKAYLTIKVQMNKTLKRQRLRLLFVCLLDTTQQMRITRGTLKHSHGAIVIIKLGSSGHKTTQTNQIKQNYQNHRKMRAKRTSYQQMSLHPEQTTMKRLHRCLTSSQLQKYRFNRHQRSWRRWWNHRRSRRLLRTKTLCILTQLPNST